MGVVLVGYRPATDGMSFDLEPSATLPGAARVMTASGDEATVLVAGTGSYEIEILYSYDGIDFEPLSAVGANGRIRGSEVPAVGYLIKPFDTPFSVIAARLVSYTSGAPLVTMRHGMIPEGFQGDGGGGASGPPLPHASSHEPGGSDPLTALDTTTLVGVVPDANLPANLQRSPIAVVDLPAHATRHRAGGNDPLALDLLAPPTDTTTLNASTSAHGLLTKLSGNAAQFLNGAGAFAAPASLVTDWTTVPFDAANYWAGVTAAHVGLNAYTVIGNTMFWVSQLVGAPAPGPASPYLFIAVPGGRTIFNHLVLSAVANCNDGGAGGTQPGTIGEGNAGSIVVSKNLGGNWVGPCYAYFTAIIAVG